MGRDVAHRSGPDPVADQDYVTLAYLQAQGGLTGLPFSEELNTLVYLGNIGPMKFGFWGGVVGGDVETIIPDGANDVNQCLTCMSIVFTPMPSREAGHPHVAADVFEQAGHPTGEDDYWGDVPANLVPGGNAHTIISVPDKMYIGVIQGEVQVNVEADGSVVIYRSAGSSDFYVGMFLMWI
jgi:hypothetical protein